MNTNLKVILTAIGIAALASPVMAQTGSHSSAPSTSISNARGSAAHGRINRAQSTTNYQGNHTNVDDCVRTAFPQCSGGQ
jgi:hypothetical protein